jgi:thioredoxin-related protein
MKVTILSLIAVLLSFQGPIWLTDMGQAKADAAKASKPILLNFSGSDWCAPCIKMKRDVFEQPAFADYANLHLVLVQADFPRTKKKQLAPELKASNEKLAEQYNPQGKFPFTLLLDADGKVLHSWDGYAGLSVDEFISEMGKAAHGK